MQRNQVANTHSTKYLFLDGKSLITVPQSVRWITAALNYCSTVLLFHIHTPKKSIFPMLPSFSSLFHLRISSFGNVDKRNEIVIARKCFWQCAWGVTALKFELHTRFREQLAHPTTANEEFWWFFFSVKFVREKVCLTPFESHIVIGSIILIAFHVWNQ